MNYNLSVFQEPRGVMRIIQFIFSICAFATITGYSDSMSWNCPNNVNGTTTISYPFRISFTWIDGSLSSGDLSSDAQFFVATGVLSFLYCIFIILLYVGCDELYKSKTQIPLADFVLTVILAVFWLSGSAAWANGLTGLKSLTTLPGKLGCIMTQPLSYSGLNISVILGFLNFFLWASDLWFLYKETTWFQMKQANSGPITPTV